MSQQFFTYVFRGELLDVNSIPTQYISGHVFHKIVGKTIYYSNYANLSSEGSILRASDIQQEFVDLAYIIDIINNCQAIKIAWGNLENNRDLFICQGYYTDINELHLQYVLPIV